MSKRFTDTGKWDDKWFRGLGPASKLLFLFIIDRCDLAGFYEIDEADIAFRTGLPEDKVLGAIQGLGRGLITKGDWVWVKKFLFHQKNLPLNPDNNAHKHIIQCIANKLSIFPDVPKKLGAKKGLFSPIGKGRGNDKGKGTNEFTPEFDEFWDIYPNPAAKVEAFKVWIKKKCVKDKDVIIKAVRVHMKSEDWTKDNGDFIPHARTWLNQERWRDDIKKKSNNNCEVRG